MDCLSDRITLEGITMSLHEIVAELPKLTFDEQQELIEKISQNMSELQNRPSRKIVPASQLRGILKTTQPQPTDEEIRQDYMAYLERKYS